MVDGIPSGWGKFAFEGDRYMLVVSEPLDGRPCISIVDDPDRPDSRR